MPEPAKSLRLPNEYTSPPGQWRYRVPETGQKFVGSNKQELLSQLRAHYEVNGYPFPDDIEAKIEDYICETVPDYCEGTGKPSKPGLAHTFHVVMQGTKTLGSWFIKGREFVPQEQADRRAATCASCVLNDEPEGCTSCNMSKLHELVEKFVGKRKTSSHDRLKSCRACLCNNRVKVWLPLKILIDNTEPEDKERLTPQCWILEEERNAATK